MPMADRMPMIAITISGSMSVKPDEFLCMESLFILLHLLRSETVATTSRTTFMCPAIKLRFYLFCAPVYVSVPTPDSSSFSTVYKK